jgi:hypothetical protein
VATPADISNNTKALNENTRQLKAVNAGITALNINFVALVKALTPSDDDIHKETPHG